MNRDQCHVETSMLDSPSSVTSDDIFANSSGRDLSISNSRHSYERTPDDQLESHTSTSDHKLKGADEIIVSPLNNFGNSSAYFRPITLDSVHIVEDSDNSSQGTSSSTNTSVKADYDMETSLNLHESLKKITLVDDSDKSCASILDMSVDSNDHNYSFEKTTGLNIICSAKKHVIKNWLSNVSLTTPVKLQCETNKIENADKNLKNNFDLNKIDTKKVTGQKLINGNKLTINQFDPALKCNYSPKTSENRKLSLNSNIANIKKDEIPEKSNELIGRYNLRNNRRQGKENAVSENKSDVFTSSNLYFNSKEQSVCIRNPTTKIVNGTGSISTCTNNKISYRQKKKPKIRNSKVGDEQNYMSDLINSVMSTKFSSDDESFSSIRRKSYVTRLISNDKDETVLKYKETPDSNLFTPRRKLFFRKAFNNSLDDEISSEEPCQDTLLVNNAVTSTPMLKSSRLKGLSSFINDTLNSFQNNQGGYSKVQLNLNPESVTYHEDEIETNNEDKISECYGTNEPGNISPILTGENMDYSRRVNKETSSIQENYESGHESTIESAPMNRDTSSISPGQNIFSRNSSEPNIRQAAEHSNEKVQQEQYGKSIEADIDSSNGGSSTKPIITKEGHNKFSSSFRSNDSSSSFKAYRNIDPPSGKSPEGKKNLNPNKKDLLQDSVLICSDSSTDSSERNSTRNESFVVRRIRRRLNRINSNEFDDDININYDQGLTQKNTSCESNNNYFKTEQNLSGHDAIAVEEENYSTKHVNISDKKSPCISQKYIEDKSPKKITMEDNNCCDSIEKINMSLTENKDKYTSNEHGSILRECSNNNSSKKLYEENTLPANFEESFASIDSILCLKKDEKGNISKHSNELLHNSFEKEAFDNTRTFNKEIQQNELMDISGEKYSPIINYICPENNSGDALTEDEKQSHDNCSINKLSRVSNAKYLSHINTSGIFVNTSGHLEENKNHIFISHEGDQKLSNSDEDSKNYEGHNTSDQVSCPTSQNISTIVLSDGDDSFLNICRSKTPLKKNRLNHSHEDDIIEINDVKELDDPWKSNKDRRKKKSLKKYNPEMLIYKENDDFNDSSETTNSSFISSENSSSQDKNEPWVDLATYLKKSNPAYSEFKGDSPVFSKKTLTDVILPCHSFSSDHTSFLLSLTGSVPAEMCHPEAVKYRESFETHKNALIDILFKLYNEEIFENKLPIIEITWSGHLTTTSGITKSRSRITKYGKVRTSEIKLSKTIVDCASKLRDVLIHELCHAANWLIDEEAGGHGPLFKKWANIVWTRFPEIPKVKVCHRYELKWKYLYKCTYCGYELGKMKLNIKEDSCRLCGGRVTVNVN